MGYVDDYGVDYGNPKSESLALRKSCLQACKAAA